MLGKPRHRYLHPPPLRIGVDRVLDQTPNGLAQNHHRSRRCLRRHIALHLQPHVIAIRQIVQYQLPEFSHADRPNRLANRLPCLPCHPIEDRTTAIELAADQSNVLDHVLCVGMIWRMVVKELGHIARHDCDGRQRSRQLVGRPRRQRAKCLELLAASLILLGLAEIFFLLFHFAGQAGDEVDQHTRTQRVTNQQSQLVEVRRTCLPNGALPGSRHQFAQLNVLEQQQAETGDRKQIDCPGPIPRKHQRRQ